MHGLAESIDSLAEWKSMSLKLLYAALNISEFCDMSVNDMNAFDYESAILSMINAGITASQFWFSHHTYAVSDDKF